jgi:hypothetical protein
MTSKSKSKQEEALQFLDDLDSLNPASPPQTSAKSAPTAPRSDEPTNEAEAAEALAFLDEITQRSSEPTRTATHFDKPISRAATPSLRKSTERVKVGSGSPAPVLPSSSSASHFVRADPSAANKQDPTQTSGSTSGWGWGNVWTSASAAIQQAKTVVDEQVKNLPKNDQAKKWSEGMMEYAKNAQLDKLGLFCRLSLHRDS